jgi:hypothetical protein
VVAAIVLWSTVYLERAVATSHPSSESNVNLTGYYYCRKDAGLRNRKSRPLRTGKPGPHSLTCNI